MPGSSSTQLATSALPGVVGLSNRETIVLLDTVTDGITAHSGGGQTNAVPLTSKANRVATVAVANDSVLLPPAVAGLTVKINNASANNVAVFPQNNGDIINALAVNTAYAQAQGTQSYTCYTTGKWVTP